MLNKMKLVLCVCAMVCSTVAYSGGKDVSRPGKTGSSKLDSFVKSSFDLYDKNSALFKRVDDLGILTASMVSDPVGFTAETGSGSVDDAVVTAKSQSSAEVQNWQNFLKGRSVSDVADSLEGNTKTAFLSRIKGISNTFDVNKMGDSATGVGAEAQDLLSSSNELIRDVPKNPLKIKKYMQSLNAAKKVLKKLAVEYPEKVGVLSKFLGS